MDSEVRSQNEQSKQDQALDLYLEGLLAGGATDKVVARPDQPSAIVSQPEKVGRPESGQPVDSPKAEEIAEKKKSGSNLPANRPEVAKTKKQAQSGQPESSRFKLLSFKVGGLTFAAPLSDISGAVSFPDNVSIMQSQPEWFMGVFLHKGNKISIADTGRLINHSQPDYKRSTSLQPYSTILLMKDGKWGLACDEIDSVICSSKEEIRWREKKESRPWLTGMVINPAMALINVQNLIPFKDFC